MSSHGLTRRCPVCRRLRKFREPPSNFGRELHPRRPAWAKNAEGILICGWCALRAAGRTSFEGNAGAAGDSFQIRVVRDVATGRVIDRQERGRSPQGAIARELRDDDARSTPRHPPGKRSAARRRRREGT